MITSQMNSFQNVVREVEVHAEDEQTFLQKQYELLQGTNNNSGLPKLDSSQLRSSPGVQKTGDRRLSNSPSIQSPLGAAKKVNSLHSSHPLEIRSSYDSFYSLDGSYKPR